MSKELTPEESIELQNGRDLLAMTNSAGWKIIEGWLTTAQFHSLPDPREVDKKDDYLWRVLNAFHAGNNAKEILDNIAKIISRAEYLSKKERGEVSHTLGIGRNS